MGKETIRVSLPVPQSGVQASPLLQRLRGRAAHIISVVAARMGKGNVCGDKVLSLIHI